MDRDVDLLIDDEDEEDYAYESSGNVFADAELPNAAELHAQSDLMLRIREILTERRLTNAQMAEQLKTTVPVISDFMRGRGDRFSFQQLFAFLETLGYDAEITVHPRKPMKRISLPRRAKARR